MASSLSNGKRQEAPSVCKLRFGKDNDLDVLGGNSSLSRRRHHRTAAPLKIGMHSHVCLQFPLDIPDDVLNVGNAGFVDLFGDIVPLEAVLEIALLDQECYLDRREGS